MLPADSMVRTGDRVLDVTQQSVDPVERGILHTGTPTPGDVTLMDIGRGVKRLGNTRGRR